MAAEEATVALTAGQAGECRVVATVGEREVDAQARAFADDLGLGHGDERGVDFD